MQHVKRYLAAACSLVVGAAIADSVLLKTTKGPGAATTNLVTQVKAQDVALGQAARAVSDTGQKAVAAKSLPIHQKSLTLAKSLRAVLPSFVRSSQVIHAGMAAPGR